jgi:hypothetical protein
MKNIQFKAIEFASASEALQHTEVEGGEAILLGRRYFVVSEAEAVRMAQADVEFAYLYEHDSEDGVCRIMTIPSY